MRVLIRVAYDGTAYSGWQIQPNAVTIEGKLYEALNDLFGKEIELTGASRTDAGVHALGNVAVFDVDTRMPAEKISYALNARLPEDIRVCQSKAVPPDFHPRHTDCVKTYEYSILNDTFLDPKKRLYSHFCYGNIDVESMKKAAEYFIGEHDFSAFCASGSQVADKVRTIYDLKVLRDGRDIIIRVTGSGFLYNMVRIIAGTLIKVGQGDIQPEHIKGIIASKDRQLAGPTAPARGLTLVEIVYKELGEEKSGL